MDYVIEKYLNKRYKIVGKRIFIHDMEDGHFIRMEKMFGRDCRPEFYGWIKKNVGAEYCIVNSEGTEFWYLHTKLHRTKGRPAVIGTDGTKKWYKKGVLHRNNKPAAILPPVGFIGYYRNGKLHRVGGPAIIRGNGWSAKFEYWQKGVRYDEMGNRL